MKYLRDESYGWREKGAEVSSGMTRCAWFECVLKEQVVARAKKVMGKVDDCSFRVRGLAGGDEGSMSLCLRACCSSCRESGVNSVVQEEIRRRQKRRARCPMLLEEYR